MHKWDIKKVYYQERLAEDEENLQETLNDGWEPYAVGNEGKVVVHYFRKKYRKPVIPKGFDGIQI